MPIEERRQAVRGKVMNADIRDETKRLETLLATLPSHQGWFILEIFQSSIEQLAKCEAHLADLDFEIMSDPIGNRVLEPMRNNTATRVAGLKKTLGIDADKMKKLMKGKEVEVKKPEDPLPVMSIVKDADHTA